MPPVTAMMVIAPCVIAITAPALACHAMIRRYWLACLTIWLLAFGAGFAVARVWNFPDDHVKFAFIASLIGLVTGMLLGIPFVFYRHGWLVHVWTLARNRDEPQDPHTSYQARRQRRVAMLMFWFLAGTLASLATWFAQEPSHRDAAMFSGVVALGLIIFLGGAAATCLIIRTRGRGATT